MVACSLAPKASERKTKKNKKSFCHINKSIGFCACLVDAVVEVVSIPWS
jgi:hypothetical protein